jgi:tetratricopeptide (TPR) repeat protein
MAIEQPAQSVRVNLKGILLAVIVVCLALIAFSKLWGRRPAAEIPKITRGPLHPLTPPITADKITLIAELRARNFNKLEATLTAYQTAAENNVTQEVNVHQAFEAFKRADPAFDALLQEWVRRSPRSYAAHLARAEFLFAEAWNARGAKWASETSAQQFQRMDDYLAAGEKEIKATLALNAKVIESYALLINEQRAGGSLEDCRKATDAALKEIPASFVIRSETIKCLEPRWGGSYEQMDQFAAEAQPYVHENPRRAALKGFADSDRGDWMKGRAKYVSAIIYYTRAIAEGGDHGTFYRGRGEAFMRLNLNNEGLEDMRRADKLWPQNSETLQWLAYGLSNIGNNQEALRELDSAVDIAGPWPYEQQLRANIVTTLAQSSRETGASGN